MTQKLPLPQLNGDVREYDGSQTLATNELIDLVAGKAPRNIIYTYNGTIGSNNIGTVTIPSGQRHFMLAGVQVQSTGGDWHTLGAVIGSYVNAIGSQVTITTIPAFAGRPFRITTLAYFV